MSTPVYLCSCLLKPPIVYMCHRPFPSRCACDLLRFSETSPHLTTWTCPPHSTVPSVMQRLQWVSLDRALSVVGCSLLWNMMLWLITCMSLLLPVAMAHINCKHTLRCMQKIAQKNNMLLLVTSIHFRIHNPVPSWYCRCCVGDWYKLLSVMHTYLPAYSS